MDEILTEELLDELLFSTSIEGFFESNDVPDRSLATYINECMTEKDLRKADVINRSRLNPTYAYEIFNGTKKNVDRDKILQLSFGMELDLKETQRLLKHAGASELYSKSKRDAIILYCINKGYSLDMTENELYRFEQETITKP